MARKGEMAYADEEVVAFDGILQLYGLAVAGGRYFGEVCHVAEDRR
jgi:hypothetical protein